MSKQPQKHNTSKNSSLYDIPVIDIDGESITLAPWKQQVLLIVNVASRCGFTQQYHLLQQLQARYSASGFSVLAFPCNQFLAQEPKSSCEIKQFANRTFQASFPIFGKVKVNGPDTCPLYLYLKEHVIIKPWFNIIPWNFTKFLINKEGDVLRRYPPTTSIKKIERDINKEV